MRKNEAVEVTTIDAATEYHKEVISVTLIVRSRINILHKRERRGLERKKVMSGKLRAIKLMRQYELKKAVNIKEHSDLLSASCCSRCWFSSGVSLSFSLKDSSCCAIPSSGSN